MDSWNIRCGITSRYHNSLAAVWAFCRLPAKRLVRLYRLSALWTFEFKLCHFRPSPAPAIIPFHLWHGLTSGVVVLLDIARQTRNLTGKLPFSLPCLGLHVIHSRHDKKVAHFTSAATRQSERKKKTSLRISREVLGNLERNTKRGKRIMRFLCKVPSFAESS